MIEIKVRYFASLRENLNRDQDVIHIDKNGLTVKKAWYLATDNKILSSNLLAAINQEYVSFDTVLKAGDELAFFPPVTGG